MKKPMILIPGNGGQERYNAKFVCKNGYGINCKSPEKLNKTIDRLIRRESIISNMNKNLADYGGNKSVEKIFNLSKKILK